MARSDRVEIRVRRRPYIFGKSRSTPWCLAIDHKTLERYAREIEDQKLQYKHPVKRLIKAAQRYLGLWKQPQNLPWLFTALTELASIIPVRAVARHIAATDTRQRIIIRLSSAKLSYFSLWAASEITLFILGLHLAALGKDVIIEVRSKQRSHKDGSLSLSPSEAWFDGRKLRIGKRNVMATYPIRGADSVWQGLNEPSPAEESISLDALINLPTFELKAGKQTFSLKAIKRHIFRRLRMLQTGFEKELNKALPEQGGLIFHGCDHSDFLGSSLYLAAKQKNISHQFWPHSTNSIHGDQYELAEGDVVHLPIESSRNEWADHPQILLNSATVLREYRNEQQFDPQKPLNLIYFAGSFRFQLFPAIQVKKRNQCIAETFTLLETLGTKDSLHIKERGPWETVTELENLLNRKGRLKAVYDGAYALDFDNMVFFTVGQSSSALLEGISRGIPCFCVRDYEQYDYAPIQNTTTPREFIDALGRLYDEAYRMNLISDQKRFYKSQTNFGYESRQA